MSYDEGLAERVRETLDVDQVDEKTMFGGLAFLAQGNMVCGVLGDELIVRVGPKAFESALQEPGTRVFDFTGRVMRGWVTVSGEVVSEDEPLNHWLKRGLDFASSLPAK